MRSSHIDLLVHLFFRLLLLFYFFFFHDTPPTEIYTLSLHDALPISSAPGYVGSGTAPSNEVESIASTRLARFPKPLDRKSTRLNSSHRCISYAVFCLKKKKKKQSNAIITKTHFTIMSYTHISFIARR